MVNLQLKVNGRLEILLGNEVFYSSVQDIKEDILLIGIPMIKGYYVKFENNTKLSMLYFEGSNVYKFESMIIGRDKCGNMPLYKLTLPEKVSKIQRREFVRVNVRIPVEITEEKNKYKAFAIDLSGGGMKIKLDKELSNGSIISIKFKSVIRDELISIEGRVVRECGKEENKYIYGIKYYKINEKIREQIIRDIFNIMRKQKISC